MAGYPKLTPHNKIMIKGNNQHSGILSSSNLTQNRKMQKILMSQERSPDRVNTDESCDFFSDNVSETAAGAVPEQRA